MPTPVTEPDIADGASEHEPESQLGDSEGADAGTQQHEPDADEGTDDAAETAEVTDEEMLDAAFGKRDEDEEEGDKPETKAEEAEPKADDADPDADAEKPEDEGEKPDPDALTETERKNVSKAVVKKLERVLKDRSELRQPAAFGKEMADMAAKAKFDGPSFRGWVQTGCELNALPRDQAAEKLAAIAVTVLAGGEDSAKAMTPVQRADSLRKLAERIAPAPKPAATNAEPQFIFMPQDLSDLVATEAMKPEEAQMLAIQRHRRENGKAAANAPKPEPEREATPPAPKPPEPDRADGVTMAEVAEGRAKAEAEWARLSTVHGDKFKAIQKGVLARIKERADTTHPKGFVRLVQDAVSAELAARRMTLKKPATQVRGSQSSGKTKPMAGSFAETIDEVVGRI